MKTPSILKMQAIRLITKLLIIEKGDFGEGLHCAHSEPFFYESAYQFIDRSHSIDECGRCRPVNQVSEDHSDGIPHTWKCCSKCKPLTDKEVAIILEFKSGFEADMKQVHKLLDTCNDNCPNNHYHKVSLTADESPDSNIVDYCSVERSGHSLLYFTGNECNSKLRILRAASTHYAVLHFFLRALYDAIRSHRHTAELDAALSSGDFDHLLRACEIDNYECLFSNEVQSTHELSFSEVDDSALRKPNLEYISFRQLMSKS